MVHYGIDGKSGRAVYFELAGYVASMCHYRVDGQEKAFGDFLIGHAFHHEYYYFLFALTQRFLVGWVFIGRVGERAYFGDHRRYVFHYGDCFVVERPGLAVERGDFDCDHLEVVACGFAEVLWRECASESGIDHGYVGRSAFYAVEQVGV